MLRDNEGREIGIHQGVPVDDLTDDQIAEAQASYTPDPDDDEGHEETDDVTGEPVNPSDPDPVEPVSPTPDGDPQPVEEGGEPLPPEFAVPGSEGQPG